MKSMISFESFCSITFLFITILGLPLPFKLPFSLSIATYNTYWLFNPYKLHEAHTACPWKDEYTANQHINEVAEVMRKVNADIWILQEVQDLCALQLLNERVGGEYGAFLVEGTDYKLGMNVAILSKYNPSRKPFRIDRKYVLPDERVIQLSRNIVAPFSFPPLSFSLLGVHLKMPRRGGGGVRQRLEIDLLVEEAKDLLDAREEALIVAGDFNDVDLEEHSADICKFNSKRLHTSDSLSRIKNELEMHNCIAFLDPIKRFTTTNQIAIDHILFSTTLMPHFSNVQVYHQKSVFLVSDHCPLKIDFQFKE